MADDFAIGWATKQGETLEQPPPRLRFRHRILLAGIGPIPVSLVGLSTFGWLSFKQLAVTVLPGALIVIVALLATNRAARRLVAGAIGAGLVSTLLYDFVRWGFLLAGWMDRDPIPHLGSGLDLEPGWVYGYIWRFIGNGGGLAITFCALHGRGLRAGAAYGLCICFGLLVILAVAPNAQTDLFPLGPATITVAVTGHLIYGTSLGLAANTRLLRTPATEAQKMKADSGTRLRKLMY